MTRSQPPSTSLPSAVDREARYRELIDRERGHAGEPDPKSPQLWDDPALFELVLAPAWQDLVDCAVAHGGPALELGCGDGDLTLALAARGLDILGVDLSEARIARAREQAVQRGLADRARFETADLNTVVLAPGRYRTIVAHHALHHVLELERLLDQVHAALAPGGVLLVNDFVGAGRVEKLMSALAVAVLPASWSYADKLKLAWRLRAMLATEAQKRAAIERPARGLHEESPFEGISQGSIERGIRARFQVTRSYAFCPYWYHALPKIRMPRALRRALLRAAQVVDRPLNRRRITPGGYLFIEARRRD